MPLTVVPSVLQVTGVILSSFTGCFLLARADPRPGKSDDECDRAWSGADFLVSPRAIGVNANVATAQTLS